MELLTFLLANWLQITAVICLIVYRKKLIWEPLSGGNGHVQMDELSKAVIVGLVIYSVAKEANRPDLDKHIFSETYFLILLSGLFSIAGLPILEKFLEQRRQFLEQRQQQQP